MTGCISIVGFGLFKNSFTMIPGSTKKFCSVRTGENNGYDATTSAQDGVNYGNA